MPKINRDEGVWFFGFGFLGGRGRKILGENGPLVGSHLTEPTIMAAMTKNLIFGITASTTYDLPYALARRFSTVDHLADGRVA